MSSLQPEVQAFVLWKLVGVSRDILANSEREHFMQVVDALMNGMFLERRRERRREMRRERREISERIGGTLVYLFFL